MKGLVLFLIALISSSQFNTLDWVKVNGPQKGGSVLNYGSIAQSPCVVKNNSMFNMWFRWFENKTYQFKLGYAVSKDGVNWVVKEDFVQDLLDVYSFWVIKDFDVYKLWYSTYDEGFSVYYLSSLDGKNWIKNEGEHPVIRTFVDEGGYTYSPFIACVLKDSDEYKMYIKYLVYSSQGDYQSSILGLLVSVDGLDWQSYQELGRFDSIRISDQSEFAMKTATIEYVLKDEETYRMWYSGGGDIFENENSLTGYFKNIGYGESRDGLSWDLINGKGKGGSLFEFQPNRFDSYEIFSPSVIKDDEGYKMWYTGVGESGMSIGYAVMKISDNKIKIPLFLLGSVVIGVLVYILLTKNFTESHIYEK